MFLKPIPLLLLILGWLCGCGGRIDPYGLQVGRAVEAAIQGRELQQEGDLPRAARAFQKSLRLSQGLDYQPGVARDLNNLGALALEQGKLAAAREFLTQALLINQELGQNRDAAINLANLATVAQKSGDLAGAAACLHAARQAAATARDAQLQAQLRIQEAGLALDRGDLTAAAELLAAQPPTALGPDQGSWHYQRGRLALAQGAYDQAWQHFAAALAADRRQVRHSAMAADLLGQAAAAEAKQDYGAAFSVLSRAAQIYLALGRREPARDCLKRLQQLKERGRLHRSLALYEAQLQDLEATGAPGVPSPQNNHPNPKKNKENQE